MKKLIIVLMAFAAVFCCLQPRSDNTHKVAPESA